MDSEHTVEISRFSYLDKLKTIKSALWIIFGGNLSFALTLFLYLMLDLGLIPNKGILIDDLLLFGIPFALTFLLLFIGYISLIITSVKNKLTLKQEFKQLFVILVSLNSSAYFCYGLLFRIITVLVHPFAASLSSNSYYHILNVACIISSILFIAYSIMFMKFSFKMKETTNIRLPFIISPYLMLTIAIGSLVANIHFYSDRINGILFYFLQNNLPTEIDWLGYLINCIILLIIMLFNLELILYIRKISKENKWVLLTVFSKQSEITTTE